MSHIYLFCRISFFLSAEVVHRTFASFLGLRSFYGSFENILIALKITSCVPTDGQQRDLRTKGITKVSMLRPLRPRTRAAVGNKKAKRGVVNPPIECQHSHIHLTSFGCSQRQAQRRAQHLLSHCRAVGGLSHTRC